MQLLSLGSQCSFNIHILLKLVISVVKILGLWYALKNIFVIREHTEMML